MIQSQTIVRQFKNETISAGATKVYQIGVADHLFLYASTDDLNYSFDSAAEQVLIVGQICQTQGDPSIPGQLLKYSTLTIRNATASAVTFTFIVANGDIDFKGLIISGTISTQSAQASTGTYASDVTAGAAAKIFNATTNPSKKHVIIFSDPANSATAANEICLGFDNSVSATNKIVGLLPGMAYEFQDFNGDIWAYCATGSKISVSFW